MCWARTAAVGTGQIVLVSSSLLPPQRRGWSWCVHRLGGPGTLCQGCPRGLAGAGVGWGVLVHRQCRGNSWGSAHHPAAARSRGPGAQGDSPGGGFEGPEPAAARLSRQRGKVNNGTPQPLQPQRVPALALQHGGYSKVSKWVSFTYKSLCPSD